MFLSKGDAYLTFFKDVSSVCGSQKRFRNAKVFTKFLIMESTSKKYRKDAQAIFRLFQEVRTNMGVDRKQMRS